MRLRLKFIVALGSLCLLESNVGEFSYQFIYLSSFFDLNSSTVSDRTTMSGRLFKFSPPSIGSDFSIRSVNIDI